MISSAALLRVCKIISKARSNGGPMELGSCKINSISNGGECCVLPEVIAYPAGSWKYEIEI